MNSHVAGALRPDGVAGIRLDRPDKLNALVEASFEDLVAAAGRVARDSNVRAVVLHGAGRAFCAGLDLSNFDAGSEAPAERDPLATRTHGIANLYQQAVMAWRNLPVPVIAAVHGVAFGGGLQFALGAEVRLVSSDARFSVMEIKWGVVPDMAWFGLMPQGIRADVMRELVYTGRVVSGEESVVLGLTTGVSDAPLDEAAVWHLKSRNAARGRYAAQNAYSIAPFLVTRRRRCWPSRRNRIDFWAISSRWSRFARASNIVLRNTPRQLPSFESNGEGFQAAVENINLK